ncbi:hypothetical protein AB6G20_20955 [Providencia hangzhouensis]|uniref:hypothetical protein n=1 Tax=Providencia hangzhouensis TaxID=3031799 RepID=UPI0034DD8479
MLVTNPNHKLQHCSVDNILKIMEKTASISLKLTGMNGSKSIQTIHISNVELAIKLAESLVGYLWLPKFNPERIK